MGQGGDIFVRALDSVSLKDADIFNTVERGAVGNGGNINISAAKLSLTDGAQLQTLVRSADSSQPGGQGEAGSVNINVTSMRVLFSVYFLTKVFVTSDQNPVFIKSLLDNRIIINPLCLLIN